MSIADQPLRTDRIDGPSEPASSSAATPPTSGRWARARTVATWVMTVLAALLVWFALVAPDRLDRLGPGAFVRIPIEGLVIVALSVRSAGSFCAPGTRTPGTRVTTCGSPITTGPEK